MLFRLVVAGYLCLFFFDTTATTDIYTLSLHDALPILATVVRCNTGSYGAVHHRSGRVGGNFVCAPAAARSEEHTSELQSRFDLVCRLLLEKKKKADNALIGTPPVRTGSERLAHPRRAT